MTQEERIHYLALAMRVAEYKVDDKAAEMSIKMLELVDTSKGEATLKDMVKIKCAVDEKYKLLEESKTENK